MPAYVACVREELWDSDRRPNVGLTEITQDGSTELTNYSDNRVYRIKKKWGL